MNAGRRTWVFVEDGTRHACEVLVRFAKAPGLAARVAKALYDLAEAQP